MYRLPISNKYRLLDHLTHNKTWSDSEGKYLNIISPWIIYRNVKNVKMRSLMPKISENFSSDIHELFSIPYIYSKKPKRIFKYLKKDTKYKYNQHCWQCSKLYMYDIGRWMIYDLWCEMFSIILSLAERKTITQS